MSAPWKLKPTYKKVEIDDVTSFDVPLYPSQLVDEAILWSQLQKDKTIGSADAAKRYVVHALRLREVIKPDVKDEELSRLLTVDLVGELFDLFFYGTKGKPEFTPLEKEATGKKKQTGLKSTGKSNSTTQGVARSKTLAAAQ